MMAVDVYSVCDQAGSCGQGKRVVTNHHHIRVSMYFYKPLFFLFFLITKRPTAKPNRSGSGWCETSRLTSGQSLLPLGIMQTLNCELFVSQRVRVLRFRDTFHIKLHTLVTPTHTHMKIFNIHLFFRKKKKPYQVLLQLYIELKQSFENESKLTVTWHSYSTHWRSCSFQVPRPSHFPNRSCLISVESTRLHPAFRETPTSYPRALVLLSHLHTHQSCRSFMTFLSCSLHKARASLLQKIWLEGDDVLKSISSKRTVQMCPRSQQHS